LGWCCTSCDRSLDADAITTGERQSSKNERCIARLVLAAAFLAAMAAVGDAEA
jgi:hypothetical protein